MPPAVGVPIKLLHEAEGFKVTAELTNGEVRSLLLLRLFANCVVDL